MFTHSTSGASPSLIREARATLILALPLVAGQVSQMLIGLADTIMIGRLGVLPLAASTFANTVIHLPLMFGMGMAIAVSIKVSQARGAGDPATARAALRHGLYLTLATALLAWAAIPYLRIFRQTEEVVRTVPAYFLLLAVSMVPAMASMAVKNHADAMNRPWPAFWILLGGVALNVLLNWLLIYGRLGAPALGLEGAGVATLIARGATLAGLLWWCVRAPGLREWIPYHWFRLPEWPALGQLVRIGLPASLQILAEVSAFVAATLLIGTIGENALAAHQVAITCAATIFMVPLGVSMALTVRTGEAWGARNVGRLRPIALSGWFLVTSFTLFSAASFAFGNDLIAGVFIDDPQARALAASLLVIAAAFQFFDAVQIVSAGVLRGLGDVNRPALIAFASYWLVAIPLSWFLAFPRGHGVQGVWWGITAGLTLSSLLLSARAWRLTRHLPGGPPHPSTGIV
ncbi:MATE family efflux transporter [soil metagenome]